MLLEKYTYQGKNKRGEGVWDEDVFTPTHLVVWSEWKTRTRRGYNTWPSGQAMRLVFPLY